MIEARSLIKRFGNFLALDDVSMSLKEGHILGLVGSNGAGKSTFMRIMAGVYRPDSGIVLKDEMPVYENPCAKDRISYISDELYLPDNFTLIKMARMYKDLFKTFDEDYFKELIVRFGLAGNQVFGSFSKGMKRQAAVLLALSRRPDVMLLDETFDGLDPIMREFVKKIICADVFDRQSCAIITSHSLRELEDICDSLALMHRGKIIIESDVENLKTKQFRVQIAFKDAFDMSRFEGVEIAKFKKSGSVANMIVKGDRDEIINKLRGMNPNILDVLPLSLEEVFSYELDALGYNFDEGGNRR